MVRNICSSRGWLMGFSEGNEFDGSIVVFHLKLVLNLITTMLAEVGNIRYELSFMV